MLVDNISGDNDFVAVDVPRKSSMDNQMQSGNSPTIANSVEI